MAKYMAVSKDLANAIYDFKREFERKENRLCPISRMKNVKLVATKPKGNKDDFFKW